MKKKIEFARDLGVTRGRVSQFLRDGMPERADGLLDFDACLAWVAANIDGPAATAATKLLGGRSGKTLDLNAERARLTAAQADLAEQKLSIARGDHVPVAEVTKRWEDLCMSFRQRVLAIPSNLATELPTLTKADLFLIDREIRDALSELADVAESEREER